MKKKKKQARIRNSIILAVLVVAAFVGLKLASSDKYAQTRTDVLEKYLSYTDTDAVTYEDYLESTNGDYISDSAEEITVKAADYKTAEMDDLKKDGEIVWTAGEGTITYEFDVKEAGWYNVRLTYYTDTDSTQNIVRNIRVNDTRLFDGCDGVTFSRLWMDDNKDWLMNTDGNQAAPTQIQSEGPAVCSITSADVDSIGAYRFFLEKGKNTISFESVQAKLGISEIALVPAKEIVSYAEYFDTLTKEGAQIIDANEVDGGAVMIQAEDTTLKSSSSLSPNNDRTSVKTVPYDPTYIIYNTIGGSNWASVGQSMTWTVDAPKAGFYKIGMRFKQYLNRGFISPRYLTINGELPFAEAAETQFAYDPDWVTGYLSGEDGDYYFYFPPKIWVENPTLDNYRDFFNVLANTVVPFARYMYNTVLVVVIGSLGHIILASLCAYPLAKYKFPGSKFINQLIVYSLMFNATVTMIPNFLTIANLGFLDTQAAIIIPGFASTLGLYLMKNFMEQIPDSLLEAAQIDGAGYVRIHFKIVMPIVKPALVTAFIMVFQSFWTNTGDKFIYTEAKKGFAYMVSQLANGKVNGMGASYAGISAAAAVIMFAVPLIVFLIMQNNVVSTMATSGMKE